MHQIKLHVLLTCNTLKSHLSVLWALSTAAGMQLVYQWRSAGTVSVRA